jgi:hypothetical protein
MQNQHTRASAALKLIQFAMTADDQECFDFLCQIIDREQLYLYYQADDGTPIKNLREFEDDLGIGRESTQATRISASAANVTERDGARFIPRRLTREERYQQRQTLNKQLGST